MSELIIQALLSSNNKATENYLQERQRELQKEIEIELDGMSHLVNPVTGSTIGENRPELQ